VVAERASEQAPPGERRQRRNINGQANDKIRGCTSTSPFDSIAS